MQLLARLSPIKKVIHIRYSHVNNKFLCSSKYSKNKKATESSTALTLSMSKPHLLYEAHLMHRRVICHVGPTNSGKTFSAINAMAGSRSGVYCGPLRLLAWEVCETLRQKNIPCSLVTGQERDIIMSDGTPSTTSSYRDSPFVACTIEMLDTNRVFDCGVIDECQLIGDSSRGWAWTRALLGMQAQEIHVCGSPAMLEIVQKLCAFTGDDVSIVSYDRLSPLKIGSNALGSYRGGIQKGDCVIGFSRAMLFKIKAEIEKGRKNTKCCIIYGNLPPGTRKEQARLFNAEDSGYDILVASDAIGMGLNLSIRRIVFSTMEKFDGRRRRALWPSEVKQIAGRAGRFQSRFESGEVISLHSGDMIHLDKAFNAPDKPVCKAGLWPSREQLEIVGIMVDYNVDDEELESFWVNYLLDDWRRDSVNYSAPAQNGITIGYILKLFESPSVFAMKLGAYLGAEHYSYDNFYGPKTLLSKLYSILKSGAEIDNHYFLCDLEEAIVVATLIDRVNIGFNDRITFCQAPLSIDDDDSISAFCKYCKDYSRNEAVSIGVDSWEYDTTPRTMDALFRLESLHKILDLYLWLAHQFPQNFIFIKEATAMARASSLKIHEGIQLAGISNYQAEKEKQRKRKKAEKKRKKVETKILKANIEATGAHTSKPFVRVSPSLSDSK